MFTLLNKQKMSDIQGPGTEKVQQLTFGNSQFCVSFPLQHFASLCLWGG